MRSYDRLRGFFGLVLLLGSILPFGLFAQSAILSRNVTLDGSSETLGEVLAVLSSNGVGLVYRSDQVDSVPLRDKSGTRPLGDWLSVWLAPTDLVYRVSEDGERLLIYRDRSLPGKIFTLNGVISDRSSGERLINANVYAPDRREGVAANEYGFYALRTNGGQIRLLFSYVGYQEVELEMVLNRDTTLNIELLPRLDLRPIVVTAIQDSLVGVSPEAGGIRIGLRETAQMGGPGGESDPMRLIRLLPGVTSGSDGLGGFNLRGSDASQNLILLDGVPVYNLNHAGGLFSIFNTQAIRRIDLYKNGIPTRFGGRLAGVVDVHTRDGNLYENEYHFGTSLLSSRFTAEGPLKKGKSSFLVSGRYFWAGQLLPSVSRDYKGSLGRDGEASYQLYDVNFKINEQLGDRDRLYFSFYNGFDALTNGSELRDTLTVLGNAGSIFRYALYQGNHVDINWGNTVGALRWNHLFSDNFFGNFSLTYSNLDLGAEFTRTDTLKETFFSSSSQTYAAGVFRSDITQLGMSFDGHWMPKVGSEIRFGGQANVHHFEPVILASESTPLENRLANHNIRSQRPKELVGYLEYVLRKPDLQFRAGIRNHLWYTGDGGGYVNWLPRLLVNTRLRPNLYWQTTFDATIQPVHLLRSATIGLPTDIWLPSTRRLAPSRAYQFSSSLRYDFGNTWEIELSGYYKRMEDLLTYEGGGNLSGEWQSRMIRGDGNAYGLEFSLNRRVGKLRGWLSYTLAKTDRTFEDAINLGRTFPFRYDHRHSATALLIWETGPRSSLTASWRFGSGAAYSISLESFQLPGVEELYEDPQLQFELINDRNSFRLPANHRLDINYRFTLKSRPGSRALHTFDIGLYNAYDRHNPIYYELRTNYRSGRGELVADRDFVQVYIAPLLPIFSYELRFGTGVVQQKASLE